MPKKLTFEAYAELFTEEDLRVVAAVNGFEQAFPQARLAWEVDDFGRPIALPDRDTWLKAHTNQGAIPLLCNGDEQYPVTLTGYSNSAISSPGRHAHSDIHLKMPMDETVTTAAPGILEAIADGVQAFWGSASPFKTSVATAMQTIHPPNPRHPSPPPPHGLPGVRLPWLLPSPSIPGRLGWLNYWSPAAADAIHFPDPSRDADLLARARRTRGGAWLVQLTDTPLDLDIPAHVDVLRSVYDRFPAIGGRDLPGPEY